MLILIWIWNSYPLRFRSEGFQTWPYGQTSVRRAACQKPGYLLQPDLSDAINVFDPVALLELRRAVHLRQIFKTSFSRSNPVPRGQATVIRSFVRGSKATNNTRQTAKPFVANDPERQASYLPPSPPQSPAG